MSESNINHPFSASNLIGEDLREGLSQFLRATSETEARAATSDLHDMLCYASVTVEDDTPIGVHALYEILAFGDSPWQYYILQLLEAINSVAGVMDPKTPLDAQVRREVIQGIPTVQAKISNTARDVRGAAITLLADATPIPESELIGFSEQFSKELDPVIQADLAYAITACHARMDEHGEGLASWVERAMGHENPAVRFRVAQYLQDHEINASDMSAVVSLLRPIILSRGLFRREYI